MFLFRDNLLADLRGGGGKMGTLLILKSYMDNIIQFPFKKLEKAKIKKTSRKNVDSKIGSNLVKLSVVRPIDPDPIQVKLDESIIKENNSQSSIYRNELINELTQMNGSGWWEGFRHLNPEISKKRQTRNKIIATINTLQGISSSFEKNVNIRENLIKSLGDDELENYFNSSTEQDWTSRPAYYKALVNELERRNYFENKIKSKVE